MIEAGGRSNPSALFLFLESEFPRRELPGNFNRTHRPAVSSPLSPPDLTPYPINRSPEWSFISNY